MSIKIGKCLVTVTADTNPELLANVFRTLMSHMLNFGGKKVYLAFVKTDMRKSINGLIAIVEGRFNLNPFDESIFVFCNRNRDRVKILE